MEADLSIREVFRIVFLQGGQILIGTLIGSGVLLLVGIVGLLLSPVLLPAYLIWQYRTSRRELENTTVQQQSEPATGSATASRTGSGGGGESAAGL